MHSESEPAARGADDEEGGGEATAAKLLEDLRRYGNKIAERQVQLDKIQGIMESILDAQSFSEFAQSSDVDKVKREYEDMQKKHDTDLLDFQRKNAARTRGLRSVRDNGAQEFANQLRDLLS